MQDARLVDAKVVGVGGAEGLLISDRARMPKRSSPPGAAVAGAALACRSAPAFPVSDLSVALQAHGHAGPAVAISTGYTSAAAPWLTPWGGKCRGIGLVVGRDEAASAAAVEGGAPVVIVAGTGCGIVVVAGAGETSGGMVAAAAAVAAAGLGGLGGELILQVPASVSKLLLLQVAATSLGSADWVMHQLPSTGIKLRCSAYPCLYGLHPG
jgi:hypothetical protein